MKIISDVYIPSTGKYAYINKYTVKENLMENLKAIMKVSVMWFMTLYRKYPYSHI